jgi:hypothetical protein
MFIEPSALTLKKTTFFPKEGALIPIRTINSGCLAGEFELVGLENGDAVFTGGTN